MTIERTLARPSLPYELRLRIGKALDRLVCDDSTPQQVDQFIATFAEFDLTIFPTPKEIDGGRFAEWSLAEIIGQCRMQSREQLDPEFAQFMAALAERFSSLAAPAPSDRSRGSDIPLLADLQRHVDEIGHTERGQDIAAAIDLIRSLSAPVPGPLAWAYSIEGYGPHVSLEKPEPSPKVSDLKPLFGSASPQPLSRGNGEKIIQGLMEAIDYVTQPPAQNMEGSGDA